MKKFFLLIVIAMLLLSGCAIAQSSNAQDQPVSTAHAGVSPIPPANDTPAASEKEIGMMVANEKYRSLTPAQGQDMLSHKGVILLDVRTREEFESAHIPGAILLPYDQIDTQTVSFMTDKNAAVVVYCRTGHRSAIAAKALVALGFDNVFDLGGIQSWPYDTVSGK